MNKDYEDVNVEETDDDVIEYVYEKDRKAESKRRQDWRKAISRFNLFKNITKGRTIKNEHDEIHYYMNNNEINAVTSTKKTKTKDASASYRHKGAYGKAKKYSPRDEKRIDSMNDALNDEE